MIGFIKGLFNSGEKSKETVVQQSASIPARQSEAFFLDDDAAKSLGDIDYMRTAKSVRRTFPKAMNNQAESERTVTVSAMLKQNPNMNGQTIAAEPVNSSQAAPAKVDQAEERRRTDTSMDMFRSMARQIKK